jgi:hypothetical protein
MNKKKNCLKSKINELATHSMNKNIRDLRSRNKWIYQGLPIYNLVKAENGDLLADSYNILDLYLMTDILFVSKAVYHH